MRTIILGLAGAGRLAGCSSETAPKPEETKAAAALKGGEYEVIAKIDDVRSTDKTTPGTKSKAGDPPATRRACVAADGRSRRRPSPTSARNVPYRAITSRNGRLSLQLTCSRGEHGQVMQLVDGDFKADSFEAKVKTVTYFEGSGDYQMTRTMTGKRVGECPAAAAKPAAGKAKK